MKPGFVRVTRRKSNRRFRSFWRAQEMIFASKNKNLSHMDTALFKKTEDGLTSMNFWHPLDHNKEEMLANGWLPFEEYEKLYNDDDMSSICHLTETIAEGYLQENEDRVLAFTMMHKDEIERCNVKIPPIIAVHYRIDRAKKNYRLVTLRFMVNKKFFDYYHNRCTITINYDYFYEYRCIKKLNFTLDEEINTEWGEKELVYVSDTVIRRFRKYGRFMKHQPKLTMLLNFKPKEDDEIINS